MKPCFFKTLTETADRIALLPGRLNLQTNYFTRFCISIIDLETRQTRAKEENQVNISRENYRPFNQSRKQQKYFLVWPRCSDLINNENIDQSIRPFSLVSFSLQSLPKLQKQNDESYLIQPRKKVAFNIALAKFQSAEKIAEIKDKVHISAHVRDNTRAERNVTLSNWIRAPLSIDRGLAATAHA